MADPVEKPAKGGTCGAKDFHNTNGKNDTCVLEKGHTGDHSNGVYAFSDAAGEKLPQDVLDKLAARK